MLWKDPFHANITIYFKKIVSFSKKTLSLKVLTKVGIYQHTPSYTCYQFHLRAPQTFKNNHAHSSLTHTQTHTHTGAVKEALCCVLLLCCSSLVAAHPVGCLVIVTHVNTVTLYMREVNWFLFWYTNSSWNEFFDRVVLSSSLSLPLWVSFFFHSCYPFSFCCLLPSIIFNRDRLCAVTSLDITNTNKLNLVFLRSWLFLSLFPLLT